MDRKIIVTGDNSKTLLIPHLNETYHSTHGAFNEAMHVFIQHGLRYAEGKEGTIKILEMGLGTGLNALLTSIHAQNSVEYTALEKYPLAIATVNELSYKTIINNNEVEEFLTELHNAPWDGLTKINSTFQLKKIKADLIEIDLKPKEYDLIYFDAFGPRVQPDLWSKEIMVKLYKSLKSGGTLVTYCAQGQFKRNLKSAGFVVESFPGPPGKREMTRAIKTEKNIH